jgi:hypothetical protein
MKLSKTYGVPFRHNVYTPKTGESLETKKIRLLGQRIKEIERETQYIKDNGIAPKTMGQSYFSKKLNVL